MKGITPVVAVILLLLITIAIVGFASIFFQRTAQSATQAGEQQLAQQLQGTSFRIENVDKNKVAIRNLGASALNAGSLGFYVNNVKIDTDSPTITPNSVGTVALNDGQLALQPEPATLKVTGSGFSQEITADFYGKYTAGYWKLDEVAGTSATDASGNGNTGSLVNSPAWVSGKYGNALRFDGSNYVNLGAPPSLRDIPTITVSAWVYPTSNAGFRDAVARLSYANGGWSLRTSQAGSGGLTPHVYTNQWYTCSAATLPLNQWSHIALTYDGETLRGYINGNIACTNPTPTGTLPPVAFDTRIAYGESGTNFIGTIDEVRILNVARSMAVA